MMNRKWIILFGIVFFALAILSFRPVPISAEKDCVSLIGTVVKIYEGGDKDVVLKLKGQRGFFYINRGLERGLDLKQLSSQLMNKEIIIKYPKFWTPLDPFSSSIHISKVEFDGKAVFSELN